MGHQSFKLTHAWISLGLFALFVKAILSFQVNRHPPPIPIGYSTPERETPLLFRISKSGKHHVVWENRAHGTTLAQFDKSHKKIGPYLKFKTGQPQAMDYNLREDLLVLLTEGDSARAVIHPYNSWDSSFLVLPLLRRHVDSVSLQKGHVVAMGHQFFVQLDYSDSSFAFVVSVEDNSKVLDGRSWKRPALQKPVSYFILNDHFVQVVPGECKVPMKLRSLSLPANGFAARNQVLQFIYKEPLKKGACGDQEKFRTGSFVFDKCAGKKSADEREHRLWNQHFTCREGEATVLGGILAVDQGYLLALHETKFEGRNQSIFLHLNESFAPVDTSILPAPSTYTDAEDFSLPHQITRTRLGKLGNHFLVGLSVMEGYTRGHYLLDVDKQGKVLDGPARVLNPITGNSHFQNFPNGDLAWVFYHEGKIKLNRLEAKQLKTKYRRSEDQYTTSYLTYDSKGIQLFPKGAVEFEFIDQFGNQIYYKPHLVSRTHVPAWRFTPGQYTARFKEESGQFQSFFVNIY